MLRLAAFAEDVAGFDAGAFRLARAEAVALDPQARTLLQLVAAARQVWLHCSRVLLLLLLVVIQAPDRAPHYSGQLGIKQQIFLQCLLNLRLQGSSPSPAADLRPL